jgi:hypothetical protein
MVLTVFLSLAENLFMYPFNTGLGLPFPNGAPPGPCPDPQQLYDFFLASHYAASAPGVQGNAFAASVGVPPPTVDLVQIPSPSVTPHLLLVLPQLLPAPLMLNRPHLLLRQHCIPLFDCVAGVALLHTSTERTIRAL